MFKVGDKVSYTFSQGMTGVGRVAYGPYPLAGFGDLMCLVEWSEGAFVGEASSIQEKNLKPVPEFEVGQVVRSSETSGLFKVVAGPFNRHTGSKWYVLEDPDGAQDMEYEAYMVPVVE